jgi:hypothetical protein
MEMVYSLLVFANVEIKFRVQNEDLVCVWARDLHRERKINPRQVGRCELVMC